MIRMDTITLSADENDPLETVCQTMVDHSRRFRCRVEVRYRREYLVKEFSDGMNTNALMAIYQSRVTEKFINSGGSTP